MQAQSFVSSIHDYFSSYEQHYFNEEQNFTADFSRGSTFYPHQEYQYLGDRGEPELPSRLYAESLNDSTLDATGLGFSGQSASSNVFSPPEEEISMNYEFHTQQTTWDWSSAGSEIISPAPLYPVTASLPSTATSMATIPLDNYVGVPSMTNVNVNAFKRPLDNMTLPMNQEVTSSVRSPAAQLPTPAAMAILLNGSVIPNSRSEGETNGYEIDSARGMGVAPGHGHSSASLGVVNHSTSSGTSSGTLLSRSNNRLLEPGTGTGIVATSATQEVSESSVSREKKHACTMCHKRFDRPSTLRKHLLVHTGEKAHVCETCGRRFGVQSNLNRHVKRCILKPVNSALTVTTGSINSSTHTKHCQSISLSSHTPLATVPSLHTSPTASSNSVSSTMMPPHQFLPSPSKSTKRSRNSLEGSISLSMPHSQSYTGAQAQNSLGKPSSTSPITHAAGTASGVSASAGVDSTVSLMNAQSSASTSSPPTTSTTTANSSASRPQGQKRRRRAPSPSQWIPATLRHFNLLSDDSYRVTSVPLPPVRRNLPKEERDSWNENIGVAPYHPCGWTGVLPGPGLGSGAFGGRDVRNQMPHGGGSKGGFVLGRIPVF